MIAGACADIVNGIDCRTAAAVIEGALRHAAYLKVDSGHVGVVRSTAQREAVSAGRKVLGEFDRIIISV
ncbi:hypothetical protein D3C84_1135820 [compost metagenome]